ncbi:MAG: type 4a pilus biogenesis protein PilO [Gemmatimonadales bacterium]|jgi:type IV pilus assembly protein PilO|nr:MAG: type 4a pilus biogenesis protein PilO [Gemmatimonadales bacterium]
MALIPQEPKQQKAIVAILLAAALFYLFYEYWRSPRMENLVEQQDRLERLESNNRAAQVRALQRERLEQQAAVYERYVRRLEQLVPAEEEVPALLRDITAEARRLNVDLNLIEPVADQPGPYYTKAAYTLRVIGEYHDVGRLLTTIASLPRIITPVNMAMEPFENTQLLEYDSGVVAEFTIETYVLPTGQQPVAPMGAAGQGGAP